MLIDWKLYDGPEPDAGIYLRGYSSTDMGYFTGRCRCSVGSGGLYNNVTPGTPLKWLIKVGEWNTFASV